MAELKNSILSGAPGVGDSGPSAHDRNAFERLIEGIDLDPQNGIGLAQNEPPSFACRFFVFPLEEETDSRLSGTLLHALIGRVLSAALNCSLTPDETLGAIFPGAIRLGSTVLWRSFCSETSYAKVSSGVAHSKVSFSVETSGEPAARISWEAKRPEP